MAAKVINGCVYNRKPLRKVERKSDGFYKRRLWHPTQTPCQTEKLTRRKQMWRNSWTDETYGYSLSRSLLGLVTKFLSVFIATYTAPNCKPSNVLTEERDNATRRNYPTLHDLAVHITSSWLTTKQSNADQSRTLLAKYGSLSKQ